MTDPKWTDAKFTVIEGPRRQRRRGWFDWRNFLIISALSLLPIVKGCLERHSSLP